MSYPEVSLARARVREALTLELAGEDTQSVFDEIDDEMEWAYFAGAALRMAALLIRAAARTSDMEPLEVWQLLVLSAEGD